MPETPVLGLPFPESTDTADVPRDLQALALAIEAQSVLPPGCGQIWFGNAAPAGWALLDGQSVDAAANPKLAAIFGVAGDWVILPDMRLRFPMGASNPTAPVREPGGSNLISLTAANLPDHQHYVQGGSDAQRMPVGTSYTTKTAQAWSGGASVSVQENATNATASKTGSPVGGVAQGIDSRPQFRGVNFIVKLG